MSAVQPGGKGSGGQRSGTAPGRRPAQAKRPPVSSQRQPEKGKRPPGKLGAAGGGKAGAPRQNMKITAAPPRRFSPTTRAFASVAVVVVVVVALVVVKVATGSNNNGTNGVAPPPPPSVAPASLVAQISSVSPSVVDAVGTGTGNAPPTVLKGQPPLTSNGKPEVLFIGAEFCPYCAAERWAIAMAMSNFGQFNGLKETVSSPWDANPETATLSFYGSSFTSSSIDFEAVEHQTNDTHGGGTSTVLEPLTTQQKNLWINYSNHFGIQTGYPFLDIGNKVFVTGPSYNGDGSLLGGLDHQEIAAKFTHASDPVTQAIVGTANYITAAVCSLTGQQPTPVCSSSGVHKAAVGLGVS